MKVSVLRRVSFGFPFFVPLFVPLFGHMVQLPLFGYVVTGFSIYKYVCTVVVLFRALVTAI